MTKPTPPYLTTALALARAARLAGVPRLATWGDRLEQAIEQTVKGFKAQYTQPTHMEDHHHD